MGHLTDANYVCRYCKSVVLTLVMRIDLPLCGIPSSPVTVEST